MLIREMVFVLGWKIWAMKPPRTVLLLDPKVRLVVTTADRKASRESAGPPPPPAVADPTFGGGPAENRPELQSRALAEVAREVKCRMLFFPPGCVNCPALKW